MLRCEPAAGPASHAPLTKQFSDVSSSSLLPPDSSDVSDDLFPRSSLELTSRSDMKGRKEGKPNIDNGGKARLRPEGEGHSEIGEGGHQIWWLYRGRVEDFNLTHQSG